MGIGTEVASSRDRVRIEGVRVARALDHVQKLQVGPVAGSELLGSRDRPNGRLRPIHRHEDLVHGLRRCDLWTLTHGQGVAGGSLQDLRRDVSQECAAKSLPSMGTHHDEVGLNLPGVVQDLLGDRVPPPQRRNDVGHRTAFGGESIARAVRRVTGHGHGSCGADIRSGCETVLTRLTTIEFERRGL